MSYSARISHHVGVHAYPWLKVAHSNLLTYPNPQPFVVDLGRPVPVDVLRLAPRKKEDSARLVSAECGVSIEGPEECLLQLNALLVPEPLVFVVGSKTYISLAPVLRCRWNGDASEGPWVVHFSFPGLVGFDKNFSNNVSVFRRPAGSSDGKWELLDLVNNEDDESDGGETVSVTVTHFSDLIAAIDNRRASENSKGCIIKPIGLRLLRRVRPVENNRLSET